MRQSDKTPKFCQPALTLLRGSGESVSGHPAPSWCRCCHQQRFKSPLGTQQGNDRQDRGRHQKFCRATQRDKVEKAVERLRYWGVHEPQNCGLDGFSGGVKRQRGSIQFWQFFLSDVLIHAATAWNASLLEPDRAPALPRSARASDSPWGCGVGAVHAGF